MVSNLSMRRSPPFHSSCWRGAPERGCTSRLVVDTVWRGRDVMTVLEQMCAWSCVSCAGMRMTAGPPCPASTRWTSAAAPWGLRGGPHARRAQSPSPQHSPACVPAGWALPTGTSCQAGPSIKVCLGTGGPEDGEGTPLGHRPGAEVSVCAV